MRDRYVRCAKSFFGVTGGTPRHEQIVTAYNSHLPHPRGYELRVKDDWCAAFVSAMAILCDLTGIIPVECSCNEQIKWFKTNGRWQEADSYVPTPGDLLYYDWNDDGRGDNAGMADHVGIVVWCAGGNILVIEGNKHNTVGYRELNVNGRYIRGYGLPDYASLESRTCRVELPVLGRGDTGEAVKALQTLLNLHGAALDVDGSFGPKTKDAVLTYQHGGVVEEETWTRLITGGDDK